MEIFGGNTTRVMGIVNVTPDSFSDGGKWADPSSAIAHGRELIAQGADILDIGGESTRPGATLLSWQEEWERIGDVVETLAAEIPVSVDTYHAQTARLAAERGAAIINDVTGGHGDPQMLEVAAEAGEKFGTAYILQHGRGHAQDMNSRASYQDVAEDVCVEVLESLQRALRAGLDPMRIILDPGFGFAKTSKQGWELAAKIDGFLELGYPVLIGVSRKRFLAEFEARAGSVALGGASASAVTPSALHPRDAATAALTQYFAEKGAWAVRVHEVPGSRAAADVAARLQAAGAFVRVPGTRDAGAATKASGARDVDASTKVPGMGAAADASAESRSNGN